MSDIRSLAFRPTPEQEARLAEMLDTERRLGAHAAAFHTPELVFEPWMASHPQFKHVPRADGSDPRLEDTIPTDPPRSVVREAVDILDQLNDGLNPSDREAADAALAVVILARAQVLVDAAKARLQP
jgi:cell division septation protein DedD